MLEGLFKEAVEKKKKKQEEKKAAKAKEAGKQWELILTLSIKNQ